MTRRLLLAGGLFLSTVPPAHADVTKPLAIGLAVSQYAEIWAKAQPIQQHQCREWNTLMYGSPHPSVARLYGTKTILVAAVWTSAYFVKRAGHDKVANWLLVGGTVQGTWATYNNVQVCR